MKVTLHGDIITVQHNDKTVSFTFDELMMLRGLGNSLFSENRSHVYIKLSEFRKLKRIKEEAIKLIEATRLSKEVGSPYHVIQKFHDLKYALDPKREIFEY